MVKIIIFLVPLLIWEVTGFSITNSAENEDELLGVAVYFRHGDRAPKKSFPTDPYFNDDYFPMGAGQLTNRGINRQYELGKWLRQRYDNFLPKQYSPKDIYVRSTNVDRTLMSASANLAGLYPPAGDQVWNKDLLWQPIPIHTLPEEEDAVVAMEKECSQLKKLYKKEKKVEFYQEINEQYAELYAYVAEQTGWEITDISDMKSVRSVFYSYSNFNTSFIPAWASNLNQTLLDYFAGLTYARHTGTDKLKLLRSGPFLYNLIEYFDSVVDNTGVKFMMYSSHNTELVSVLDAMGVYDLYPPNYAGTIIWEVRKNSSGVYYINLFYRRSETELFDLTIPGCMFDCPLEQFKTLLDDVIIDEEKWEKKCKN